MSESIRIIAFHRENTVSFLKNITPAFSGLGVNVTFATQPTKHIKRNLLAFIRTTTPRSAATLSRPLI